MKKVNQHGTLEPLFVQTLQTHELRITIEYLGTTLQTQIMKLLSTKEWMRTADIITYIETNYAQCPRSAKKSLRSLERRGIVTRKKVYDLPNHPFYQNYWRSNILLE